MIYFIAIISLSMIFSPLCHLDKNSISKDTVPENLTNSDTTKKIQGKKLFSVLVQQKNREAERGRSIKSDFGRRLLMLSHFSHL